MMRPRCTVPVMDVKADRPSRATLGRGLAEEIGSRLRRERLRAGLTQAQLSEGRYTKAYVSAIEHGLAKPSMAALNHFARRLGIDPASLIQSDAGNWSRLEADLRLASGDWRGAVDAYNVLLDAEETPLRRAELERGLAEASCRLEHPADALRAASSAAAVFDAAGRTADAARARYWQATALYQEQNDDEARSLFRALLEAVRGGLIVDADFEVRLLIALATVDSRAGEPTRSLGYLDEARALVEQLDDRRRATFLTSLAISHRERGDYEAAVSLAHQGLAGFRALEAERETAVLENELALVHLALGTVGRAREHAALAEEHMRRLGDERGQAHVLETRAQIELGADDLVEAIRLAREAQALARRTGNHKAFVSASLTLARAQRRSGAWESAVATLEQGAAEAREHQRAAQLRDVLTEWADLLAERGETRRAYELTREALALDRP